MLRFPYSIFFLSLSLSLSLYQVEVTFPYSGSTGVAAACSGDIKTASRILVAWSTVVVCGVLLVIIGLRRRALTDRHFRVNKGMTHGLEMAMFSGLLVLLMASAGVGACDGSSVTTVDAMALLGFAVTATMIGGTVLAIIIIVPGLLSSTMSKGSNEARKAAAWPVAIVMVVLVLPAFVCSSVMWSRTGRSAFGSSLSDVPPTSLDPLDPSNADMDMSLPPFSGLINASKALRAALAGNTEDEFEGGDAILACDGLRNQTYEVSCVAPVLSDSHATVCMFWNDTLGQWSDKGLASVDGLPGVNANTTVVCATTHLTDFASGISASFEAAGKVFVTGGDGDMLIAHWHVLIFLLLSFLIFIGCGAFGHWADVRRRHRLHRGARVFLVVMAVSKWKRLVWRRRYKQAEDIGELDRFDAGPFAPPSYPISTWYTRSSSSFLSLVKKRLASPTEGTGNDGAKETKSNDAVEGGQIVLRAKQADDETDFGTDNADQTADNRSSSNYRFNSTSKERKNGRCMLFRVLGKLVASKFMQVHFSRF